MKWLLLSRPVDWLIGIALRARAEAHRVVQTGRPEAGDRSLDSPSEISFLAEDEFDQEVEVVARAIDPADWQGFDAYVRKLGLSADERAAARRHAHGPTLPSLHRARRAIGALDELRREKPRSNLQDP
ncbi:hypothetical protein [Pelagibacterium limicola]|uniref:hypothetical protein n=1 Tax=Pelagibacterium limicola TaxID=2791022 RepID=UPI0018B009C9|nr:hypothetical protein [Pelagibacterium limicola]